MKKFMLAAAVLLALLVGDTPAATLSGRVVGVSDGDTATVLTAENRRFRIRLSGIDAPEKKQPFGAYAKETLAHQIFGRPVVVEWSKTDRYGRIVGKIELDGMDVNLQQLREGSAWVYTQYLRELPVEDRKHYLEAERRAKSGHIGLWHDTHPRPPWEWRKSQRAHSGNGG